MEQFGMVELTSLVDLASLSASTSQVLLLYRVSSRLGRSSSGAACFVYIASTYRSFSPSLQCRLPCLTIHPVSPCARGLSKSSAPTTLRDSPSSP